MPRIIDNIQTHLRSVLATTLERSVCLDTSVGYFNLRGWDAISERVAGLPGRHGRAAARVLVGMQDRPESDLRSMLRVVREQTRMDNAQAARLRESAAADFRQQLTWGVPTGRDARTLRDLRDQLRAGQVQVRLFLAHPLHAKLYLCHRDDADNPRTGYVGSSNLTFSGLGAQGELNVDVLDHDASDKLATWFEARWEDRFSVDITEQLIDILDESWAGSRLIPPYLIHLKIAYHLCRDARLGLVEFGLPASMQRELLEYQSAAVRIIARIIVTRGGAMLGDVVGLGKTMVATAIALVLQEERGYEALIVCPKNLVAMWQGYVNRYRLHARVMSLSNVVRDLPGATRYRLVIIDESHNLRSSTRQDYAALRDYIGRNDSKVLLLTATPFNRSMADVVTQLRLFVDDDADLGIRPEAAIAELGEAAFMALCDDKPSTLRAFERSILTEDWQRLFGLFLVRRTRRFIEDNYAQVDELNGRPYLTFGNGERSYLPRRDPRPLPFETAVGDPAGDMASDRVLAALNGLRLPRYALGRYVKTHVRASDAEQQVLDRLGRAGGNLLGFTRTMLMKRLASSGSVFTLSLQRHLLRNHMYALAVRKNGQVPVGTVSDPQMLNGDDADALAIPITDENLPTERDRAEWERVAAAATERLSTNDTRAVTWIRAALFTPELLVDLEADIDDLQALLAEFGGWSQSTDSKLDALERLLSIDHPEDKVLIFSEYADTASYVARALRARGIENVGEVTGATDDPTRLARMFSPGSNQALGGRLVTSAEEIRVLVATDVLSEGQNLQDAAIVVNFDLPWAIIKLIQRAGRVDRIGQRAEEVVVYSFLPTEGVEAVLRLRGRIADRLAQNAAVLGSDERFLNTADEAHIIRGLFQGTGDGDTTTAEPGAEQVDYTSVAYEIWRRAERDHPELAATAVGLPDVTFATLPAGPAGQGALVYTLSQHGVDRAGFTPVVGQPRRIGPVEALELTACSPDTPSLVALDTHHELVEAAVRGPLTPDLHDVAGSLTGVRRRVYDRIRANLGDDAQGALFTADADVDQAVDALYRHPLTEEASQQLARALRERTPADVLALVVALHEQDRLSIDTSSEPDDVHIVCSMGFNTGGGAR